MSELTERILFLIFVKIREFRAFLKFINEFEFSICGLAYSRDYIRTVTADSNDAVTSHYRWVGHTTGV